MLHAQKFVPSHSEAKYFVNDKTSREIMKHKFFLMETMLPRYCFEKKSAACQFRGSVRPKTTRNDAPEARTFLEKKNQDIMKHEFFLIDKRLL